MTEMKTMKPEEVTKGETPSKLIPCDRKRALVVDDEKAITLVFRDSIEHVLPGLAVDSAENGQVALEAFSKGHHAVLIMDLSMPVMDGQRAYQEIEKVCRERNWEMPSVLFCTGYAPPGSLSRILNRPMHGLLLKPISGLDVARAVQSRLRR